MGILDHVDKKEKIKPRFAQVKIEPDLFNEIIRALDEDGISMQDILHAGLTAYLSERTKKGKKNGKARSGESQASD